MPGLLVLSLSLLAALVCCLYLIRGLRRRLDHSGMCEARLTARLADLGNAIRIRRVRGADLPHESVAAAD